MRGMRGSRWITFGRAEAWNTVSASIRWSRSNFWPNILWFIRRCFFLRSPGGCRQAGDGFKQFKVLFLFWFGVPVFAFYFLLSFNKVAAPNWDALAFISFGLLAVWFWRERLEGNRWLGDAAGIALFLGLFMSVLALDSDLIRSAGIRLWRRDPSDRMRGWKTATAEVEKFRSESETNWARNCS